MTLVFIARDAAMSKPLEFVKLIDWNIKGEIPRDEVTPSRPRETT
jgi:hypothetical protein